MNTMTESRANNESRLPPGVVKNSYGGYHIHLLLNERRPPLLGGMINPQALAPLDAPVLAETSVFEDCVLFVLRNGQVIVLHVSDPAAAGSVVFFYHTNGTLWRAVRVEQLNPGWVQSTYLFRGDLRKFDVRLARMRTYPTPRPGKRSPTFWRTGGWQGAVVYTTVSLVWRITSWQHSSLSSQVNTPTEEQVETLSQAYPEDVQQILAMQESGVEKVTYQVGGVHLVLSYLERIGLAEAVDSRCTRKGKLSEGTVITVLVINRLLAPCALSNVADWVKKSGLHWLMGIPDPSLFNYDRLVDALLAVYPHWREIAAQITLKAIDRFHLEVKTVHYDLTSILFHGAYNGSSWVEFGYSRDHRPDKPQVNIGLSTTADGEVVLLGGSDVHSGSTNDASTTVSAHQQLHALFQRTDLLVTGDRIMQSAENMLVIARAHGRFLGPVKWTHAIRSTVAACREEEFRLLPHSSRKAGHAIKAVFRHLHFKVKEELSDAEREQLAQQRRRRKMRGKTPSYRQVRFWMRATIILDMAKRKADAKRRHTCIQAYEAELEWTSQHLNKGRFYGDPEWVENHVAELSQRFKDVRTFVKVTFSNQDGVMSLAYQRLPKRIAQAAKLDGKWVLVTNQPPTKDQSPVDYMDWMLGVYKNHCHVERRMRNLKSNLPIRPIYLHRDEAIVALCFTCMVALMTYTLIERDCQSNPALVKAGLTTTDKVLGVLSSFGLSICYTLSGHQVFWLDTPRETHQLIWHQLLPDTQGIRVPAVRPDGEGAVSTPDSPSFLTLTERRVEEAEISQTLSCPFQPRSAVSHEPNLFLFAIVKVLLIMLC